jgi:hypothetical protein
MFFIMVLEMLPKKSLFLTPTYHCAISIHGNLKGEYNGKNGLPINGVKNNSEPTRVLEDDRRRWIGSGFWLGSETDPCLGLCPREPGETSRKN